MICDYDISKRQIFNKLQLRLFLTRPWNRTKSISFWHKNGSKCVLKALVLILFPLLLEREYVQKIHINITKQGHIVTIVGSREQHLHPRGHRTCSLLGETNGCTSLSQSVGSGFFTKRCTSTHETADRRPRNAVSCTMVCPSINNVPLLSNKVPLFCNNPGLLNVKRTPVQKKCSHGGNTFFPAWEYFATPKGKNCYP